MPRAARLSEQVAKDAERGADAITRTIHEINRIKESSSDAVAAAPLADIHRLGESRELL